MNGFSCALLIVVLLLWAAFCGALFEVRDLRAAEAHYLRRIAELETDLAERLHRERF